MWSDQAGLHAHREDAQLLRAQRKTEMQYGNESLSPRSAFEWGMINGKLSAIRWMLGVEWDMLETYK